LICRQIKSSFGLFRETALYNRSAQHLLTESHKPKSGSKTQSSKLPRKTGSNQS
jgi:hypothetical protein